MTIDWERAFDMALRLPGKRLVRWTIMGRKTGEMWKAEAKPTEKELEWEFLLSTANSLLLISPHPLCSFLTTAL